MEYVSKVNPEQIESYPKFERDADFYETEFLQFLEYLNYHLTSSHYHSFRKIPHYVKMSSSDKSEQWTETLYTLETQTNTLNSETKEIIPTGIEDNLKSTGVLRRFMPSSENTNSENVYSVRDRKGNSQQDYFELKSSNDGHHRVRRYAPQESETSMKLKVSFKLEKSPENGNGEKFQQHLISQLAKAMRIPIPSINDMEIMSGKSHLVSVNVRKVKSWYVSASLPHLSNSHSNATCYSLYYFPF